MSTSGRREGVGEVPHLIIVFICCINMAALSFIYLVVFVLCFFLGGGVGMGRRLRRNQPFKRMHNPFPEGARERAAALSSVEKT